MTARSADPVLAFQFALEVNEPLLGLFEFKIPIRGYFTEVSGLDVEWEMFEYKTTSALGLPHSNFVPLRPVYRPITLKRGVTDSEAIWIWHELLGWGAKPVLTASLLITLFDRSYDVVAQWGVSRAWPSKISGPQLRSDSSDILIEELTLTHHGVERLLAPTSLVGTIRTTLMGAMPSPLGIF